MGGRSRGRPWGALPLAVKLVLLRRQDKSFFTWLEPGHRACRGRTEVRVVAQGGDSSTTDIGFGCLSGMFERNDDVLYICYDNEAYMNTGVQRSSAPRAPPPRPRSGRRPAMSSVRARACR